MLIADDSLWVAEHHGLAIGRLDPSTGAVQARITGVGFQAAKPFEAGGLIWVPSPTSMVAVDPATNEVVRTIQGVFSFVGAYAANHIWIGNGTDELLEIDPAKGTTVRTIAAPHRAPEGCQNTVQFADGSIWWPINDQALMERIDPATGQVTATIRTPVDVALTAVDGALWGVSSNGTAFAIDTASNTLFGPMQYAAPAPDGQCALGGAAIGKTLWLVDPTTDNFIVGLDTTTGQVSAPINPSGTDVQDIVVQGTSLWTDFFDSGGIVRLDPPAPA
jgi:streptogramin lyase